MRLNFLWTAASHLCFETIEANHTRFSFHVLDRYMEETPAPTETVLTIGGLHSNDRP